MPTVHKSPAEAADVNIDVRHAKGFIQIFNVGAERNGIPEA